VFHDVKVDDKLEPRVGIGTTTPKQTLHVAGDYYGKGHMWLHATEGDGRSGTAYIQARDSGSSTINLRLRTQESGELKEVMHLDSTGNVGIGTISPGAKLQIDDGGIKLGSDGYGIDFFGAVIYKKSGDGLKIQAHTDHQGIDFLNSTGNSQMIITNGQVGIGTTSQSAKLHVNGRIKDQTGFVLPVGTVVSYAGSTAPEGWLVCDGQGFDTNKYSELYEVLGRKNKVPDLRKKFIAGAGNGYALGEEGGEDKHKLTSVEMPNHNHNYNEFEYLLKSDGHHTYRDGNDSNNEPNLLHQTAIQSRGRDQPHENRPPFYALTYIIKA
jgi:microcystin-dependent protein